MLPLQCQNLLFILVHLNIQTLKLAPILAQYLYANKRLDLPGIGSFSLDAITASDPESNKQTAPEGIHFESNPSTRESPDLVAFISAQTGKMKALAAADLSSHLELVQQFLNIGKPFLLEGIGSLAKIRQGEFSFSGAGIPTDKLKDNAAKEAVMTSATEESFSSYDSDATRRTIKLDWRKPMLVGLAVLGTGLAIWGGYTVYKRSQSNTKIASASTPSPTATTLVQDTLAVQNEEPVANTAITASSNYKFVLETANKNRAFVRYERLKNFQWNVQMETKDSVKYKLFLLLPAIDTNWVLDSLTALNGRRVYIER